MKAHTYYIIFGRPPTPSPLAAPQVGQLSFVETEEALKMSPGRDVRLKLSLKKTVVLLKILFSKIVGVSVQLIADTVGIRTGWFR